MRTPAWVITGLLDSGKTTLINKLMEEELHELNVLVIQFESGEEALRNDRQIQKLVFSKSQLEQLPMSITDRILEYLEQHNPDLMLVEWNGMEHFHKLEEMLLQFSAAPMVSVEKVIYMGMKPDCSTGFPMPEPRHSRRLQEATALTSEPQNTYIAKQTPGSFITAIRISGCFPSGNGSDLSVKCFTSTHSRDTGS